MKIALIDNMNNNFFAFARYLRDLGVDAHLYLIPNRTHKHFMPQADTFNDISGLSWIHNFPVNVDNKNWLFFNGKSLRNEFSSYDLIISCGLSAAYLSRAKINIDIFMPFGADLYDIPFRKIIFKPNFDFIRSILWSHQAKFQKRAFSNSKLIITDDGYKLYSDALKKLKISAFNLGIPMLYNRENLNNEENKKLWNFLKKYDFIVFNHSRQYWKSNLVGDALVDFQFYKGLKRNDKIIKAFAKFTKITKFKSPVLILFEYGVDVEASKHLIKRLNISKYVKWFPTMNRKNILYGLEKATFSSNAFRENKTDIGGVCYESLAVGTLHLNNCFEAVNNPNHKFYKAPMVHVLSEDDILNIFIDYEKNPNRYQEICYQSKKWFDDNLGIGLAKKYVELIELLVKGKFSTEINLKIRNIFE